MATYLGTSIIIIIIKKHANNILRMKDFNNLKYKTYLHEMFNTLKEFVRKRELSLTTPEKIDTALRKEGVTNFRKIYIYKREINKF